MSIKDNLSVLSEKHLVQAYIEAVQSHAAIEHVGAANRQMDRLVEIKNELKKRSGGTLEPLRGLLAHWDERVREVAMWNLEALKHPPAAPYDPPPLRWELQWQCDASPPVALTRQDIANKLQDELPALADRLLNLARPAIGLWPQRVRKDIPVGASRLGGMPYAPPGWSWPAVSYGEPMLFVGQINCEELHGLPGTEKLPPSGLLAFFGDHDDVMGCNWAAGARVYYWPDIERLEPAIPPLEPSMIFPQCELRSRPFTDLPDPYSCVIDELVKDQEQVSHYARIRETIRNHGIPEELPYYCSFSKLFGWPSLIQKCDLELFRCETPADVHLLLQVDDYSNGEDSHGWGPGGSLYFLMHDRDLRKHRFDRCEFEIQFT